MSVAMRHEDWVCKAEGGKAGYGENDESEAAEGERVDTNQEHTRYGFYSSACASTPLRLAPSAAVDAGVTVLRATARN